MPPLCTGCLLSCFDLAVSGAGRPDAAV